ncbi:MAG: Rrf2 family transcriptional regulator [Candidatus Tectimicrobiota bacterium]|nr:MAG: Rrf2 family transcriptional regulator [Candidatus Tectomicrobia bacterium]
MRFSLSTEYALHGLLFLALHPQDAVVMLPEVARALRVSEPSLRKVFQTLARSGLVVSYRGTKGGYSLALPPEAISLQEVVQAVEGQTLLYQCMSAHGQCEPGPQCVIGSAFQEVEAHMRAALRRITLADLAARLRDGSKRVQWLASPSPAGTAPPA